MPADAEFSGPQGDDVHLTEAEPTGKYSTAPPVTCHVGPHWGCMLVTYCLAVCPAFFFFAHDMLLGLKVALLVSICLSTVSFTMVACSDPGVVFQDLEVPDQLQGDIETGIICGRPWFLELFEAVQAV
jgi:hypothetical protein